MVAEGSVEGVRLPGDTAYEKALAGRANGCETLDQRLIRFAAGRSRPRRDEERDTLLYVVRGYGSLELDGVRHDLEPDMGVFVAAGETWAVDSPASGELELVAVLVDAVATAVERRRVTVRHADQPGLPAAPNREFRYLVNQDAGCLSATQFLGVIPPGRPGVHSHTYDEVVYVLEGDGVLHADGRSVPIGPGSGIHLPPLTEHALENAGGRPMRVLGVFHPSGDPASRAYEEATTTTLKEG